MALAGTSSSVLQLYYPHVSNLSDFILLTLRDEDKEGLANNLVLDSDSENYQKLVNGTLIGCSLNAAAPNRVSLDLLGNDMGSIISTVQKQALKRTWSWGNNNGKTKPKSSNMLTYGYTYRGNELKNDTFNTNVTALHNTHWEELLKRVGTDMMTHLLTNTSIFVPLGNDCFCQLSGQPIVHTRPPVVPIAPTPRAPSTTPPVIRKRTNETIVDPGRSAKRLKLSNGLPTRPNSFERSSPHAGEKRTPVEINFERVRLFYARPSFLPHTRTIAVGLPPKHVFNIFRPPVKHSRANDQSAQMEDARHLAKYVFPRQYGLPSVFDARGSSSSGYMDREDDIKKLGPHKTPKRLKQAVDLLEKSLWHHGKCRYKLLRNLACPSKLPRQQDRRPVDSSILLELISEDSIHLSQLPPTATSFSSADRTTSSSHLNPTQTSTMARKAKPRFAEFVCTHVEVFRYVVLVTKAVVPQRMWGSAHNFSIAMKAVKDIISTRRYETITLHNALQGFCSMECKWLDVGDTKHAPPSEHAKRREIIEEFMYWYISCFVIPLLRTTFYITESSAFRNRILYFRQDDWDTLCAPLIERLTSVTFTQVDGRKVEEVPAAGGYQQSINDILQAAFQILTYEKDMRPELLGSSVLGQNGIYGLLKDYKLRLQARYGVHEATWPKLYFVKVDVQACFDTIEQTKLLRLLRDIISEDEYSIIRYGEVTQTTDKIKRTFHKKACPADDPPHFLKLAKDLAHTLRSSIFVDQVNYPTEKRHSVLELLEEHITENYVKIGGVYYQQIVGIPQGSVCSSLLCSYFYADLERKRLHVTKDPESALLRLIDDYLFITTDLEKARTFLKIMQDGHPDYGCFISQEKTLTNFEGGALVLDSYLDKFPWCGLFINTKDLSVSTDYTRFHESYLSDSLTVHRGKNAGKAFVHKILQLSKAKSHIIYCDTSLSSQRTVYLNIYQNFLLVAMKTQRYLRSWGRGRVQRNTTFIHRTIQHAIRYTYAAIRSKEKGQTASKRGGKVNIKKAIVLWLGMSAFHQVLSVKPSAYSEVLQMIAREPAMSSGKSRGYKSQFRDILQEGSQLMEILSYSHP
ncbi:unnamed protein product [Peniophora sp. CBMAI 1063]|nr:unnamed protein product [Peniophora sp. CBMAI 1063]